MQEQDVFDFLCGGVILLPLVYIFLYVVLNSIFNEDWNSGKNQRDKILPPIPPPPSLPPMSPPQYHAKYFLDMIISSAALKLLNSSKSALFSDIHNRIRNRERALSGM